VPPRYRHDDAQAAVDKANAVVAKPLPVAAGAATATASTNMLRTWIHSTPGSEGLELVIDPAQTGKDLAKLLAAATKPAVETTYVVVDGRPQPKFGTPGQACCADNAPALVEQALFEGARGTAPAPAAPPAPARLQLPLKALPPKINPDNVGTFGVKEQVSTFTTNHPAGQPRVTNIHRMADIVKGTVIMPGETFSLNGRVGERTVAKGFVVDHQINDEGKFDDAVGGGVSQFATPTFNAAFFAGLDYGEYQSHSIYISRYPYGREATVSWQHPDLQVKNTTPFAVMIWATYTGTSLTVSMYSTKYLATVTQSAQVAAPFGPGCTRVVTERTRTYLDGHSIVDKVFAVYQPAEGVKCR
jgi:hypothetical protein